MAGGFFQLVAKGVEDIFITNDPQISFFATVYRRYSNFSMESIDIPVQGKQDFGTEVFAIIEKRGDILGKVYFNVELPEMMATFDKNVRDILNQKLIDLGIPPFGPLDPITPDTVQAKIDNEKNVLMNQKNFYDYLIAQLETTAIKSNFDTYAVIADALLLYATGADLGLVYVYQSLIQSSENKVEIDGTHNLIIRNDLSAYNVIFRQQICNMTKGNSHVILNTKEIIKALTSRIYYLLFGDQPSEIWFIANFHYYNAVIVGNMYLYLQLGSFNQRGQYVFENVSRSSNLIDIFTTYLKLIDPNTVDIVTETEQLFGLDYTDAVNLLDTPFYIRLNNLLINKPIQRKFTDNDIYKYLIYYFNQLGPTLQNYLDSKSITDYEPDSIQNALALIYYDFFFIFGPGQTGILWLYEASSYLLNVSTFMGLTQHNGNLVYIKRYAQSSIIDGDILEYSDFFYGPNITPSNENASSTPTWVNPNLTPDPYWFEFITLQLRQTVQNAYSDSFGFPFSLLPFLYGSNLTPLSIFATVYPAVQDLTIVSNVSDGLTDFAGQYPKINNYNLYVDNAVLDWRTEQFLTFKSACPNDQRNGVTMENMYQSALFAPFYVSRMCAREAIGLSFPNTAIFPYTGTTYSANYAIFDANTAGNSFFELNYYKWFTVGADVDPKMFRIRYINGALALIHQYLLSSIIFACANTIALLGTPTDVALLAPVNVNAGIQISELLLNTLFPRKDNTLPLSITNDKLYDLLSTMLNSIPAGSAGFTDYPTVVANLVTAFANNSTQYSVVTTLVNIDPFYLDQDVYNIPQVGEFVPLLTPTGNKNIPQAIDVYIYNKDSITGAELFDIYVAYYNRLLATNAMSTFGAFIIKQTIEILGKIQQRYINSKYNRQTLVLPDIDKVISTDFFNIDFINTFLQSHTSEPSNGIAVPILRSVLSFLIGATETWDGAGFPTISVPITTYGTGTLQNTQVVTQSIFILFSLAPPYFYYLHINHRKNYNNLFKNKLMNFENLRSNVGISNANRITNHLSHLIDAFNTQVDVYNNYVTVNTPSAFIPLLKEKIDPDNVDFSKFGTVPVDIVTNLFDYNFVRQIRYEIDPDPAGSYLGLSEEAFNFLFNILTFNWKRTLYDISLFKYPNDNLLFTNVDVILNYYFNTMLDLNTVLIPQLSHLNIPGLNIYGTYDPNGNQFITPDVLNGVEVDFLITYLSFIFDNFYTIDELWNYFFSSAITYIINLAPPDLAFLLTVNQNFWNSISPLNMYNNLNKIEKSNPNGFRFTDLYISFIIEQLFGQVSFLTGVNLTNACDIQTLISVLQQKSAISNNRLCKIISSEADILDFVNATQFQATNARFSWVEKIGHVLLDSVSFEIQGEEYERLFFDWLEIYHELTKVIGQERGYNKLIGNVSELTTFNTTIKPTYQLHIPLPFLFCRFSNYHIPLICSQYQSIIIRVRTKKLLEICHIDDGSTFKKYSLSGKQLLTINPKPKYSIQAEYIYLEQNERKQFATAHQEYLVELLQNNPVITLDKNNIPDESLSVRLHFTNNCRYLVWNTITKQNEERNNWLTFGYNKKDYEFLVQTPVQSMIPLQKITNFNYTQRITTETQLYLDPTETIPDDTQKSIFNKTIIKFNGLNRINEFTDKYFELYHPYSYSNGLLPQGCGMYSFSLSTNMMQPSGSCNFSKIDDVTMLFDINPEFRQIMHDCNESFKLKIYSMSVNVLRYLSGMCGRAFFTAQ